MNFDKRLLFLLTTLLMATSSLSHAADDAEGLTHIQGEMSGEVTADSVILQSRLTTGTYPYPVTQLLSASGDVPGRMGVNHGGDVFRQQFRRLREQEFVQQFRGVVAHDVCAQQFVRLWIAQYLYQSGGFSYGNGLSRPVVGKYRLLHLDTLAPRIVFAQSEPRHLRLAVDRRGHQQRIHRLATRRVTGHVLYCHLPFR